ASAKSMRKAKSTISGIGAVAALTGIVIVVVVVLVIVDVARVLRLRPQLHRKPARWSATSYFQMRASAQSPGRAATQPKRDPILFFFNRPLNAPRWPAPFGLAIRSEERRV